MLWRCFWVQGISMSAYVLGRNQSLDIFMFVLVVFRTLTWTRTPGTIWRKCAALLPNVTWMSTSALDRSTCPGNLFSSSSVACECGVGGAAGHHEVYVCLRVFQAGGWWETLRSISSFGTKPRCRADTFLQGESTSLMMMTTTMMMTGQLLSLPVPCLLRCWSWSRRMAKGWSFGRMFYRMNPWTRKFLWSVSWFP